MQRAARQHSTVTRTAEHVETHCSVRVPWFSEDVLVIKCLMKMICDISDKVSLIQQFHSPMTRRGPHDSGTGGAILLFE